MEMKYSLMFCKYRRKIEIYKINLKTKIEVNCLGTKLKNN
jgi:hypothetical protein